jgi:hypothetical protein
MEMVENKMIERARIERPRCIAGFQTLADTEITTKVMRAFRRDPNNSISFELRPNSVGGRAVLRGCYLDKDWPDRKGRILVSPLEIKWVPSGEVVPLFDGTQHGYNPEYGLGRVHSISPNAPAEWTPPEGLYEDLLYVACFSYNPSDQEWMETDEVMRLHPQDFFETFLLAAYSPGKDAVIFVTEFECA